MATKEYETRTFAGISLIDSRLVQSAIAYARDHLDSMSFHHVYRSWVFGAILASKIPRFENTDLEIHAVSCLLHDLAWDYTSKFSTTDKRFEVDGANAAREFLNQAAHALDERQLQLVWDSIALHTTPSIAQHKEAEVALCNMGITVDFMGPAFPGGLITQGEYDAVNEALPRLEFKESVKRLMCGLCVHKPGTTYDNFVRDIGERFVEGYTVPHTFADFLS